MLQEKQKHRKYERTIRVLKMIAVGALIVGLGGAPSLRAVSRLLKEFILDDSRENRRYANRKIKQMKRHGFLKQYGVRYAVSDKGKRLLAREEIQNLHIQKLPQWNRKWYLILFDIPQSDSDARKALNRVLLRMGLAQYQQSVLIYPYPIKETVLLVCKFYKVSRYVSFITASHVEGEDELKRYFKLA